MDKNAIKKFATWARRELIERVRQQAYRYEVEGVDADWNASIARGVVLTPVQRTQRQALIERMRAKGYETTIEEVAYTWFDRFCALRFMEVNGYLPGRTRMFSDENGAFRPQILTDALNVQLDGLDLDTVIRLKEENKNEELFKYLLLTMCNALKPILTLFQPDDRGCHLVDRDYTWLLLPDNLLREGGVPEQMVLTIPEDDWKDAVQIVGWLYQYYNAEPKDQVFANLKKNIKIGKKDIPAATQLFTPDWIVRYMVENSLGRLWVEGHPDHENLKGNWKYYLEEAEQEPDVQAQLAKIRESYAALKPEELLCIDPCMGSGHILVYLFDVLVQIYEAYGYPTREAVASIVQNNLWGLDIDDRAAQLANFAVMMVARRYDKGWFRRGVQPHVMAIQESNGINRDHLRYLGNSMSDIERNNATMQIEALLDEFIDAKEYGSILQPQEYDWDLLRRFVRMTDPAGQVTMGEVGIDATQERLLQIIEQEQALAQKYHVVVTNPPYMAVANCDGVLNKYVKSNYSSARVDLYSIFIERCLILLRENALQGMITMHGWMFLSSFEQLRETLEKYDIVNMAHLGARAFEEINGEVVQTTSFVLRNEKVRNYKAIYVRLVDYTTKEKEAELLNETNYSYAAKELFQQIPGRAYAYWISNRMRELFEYPNIDSIGTTRHGMTTGNNDRFLRLWHEVEMNKMGLNMPNTEVAAASGKKWFPYNKGGLYRKWYGNYEYVVNYENDGVEMKEFTSHLPQGTWVRVMSREYYFLPSLTWTKTSTSTFGVRYSPQGAIFDVAGSSLFPYPKINPYYVIGLLNTKIAFNFLKMLNPTLSIQTGDIKNLPYIEGKVEIVSELVKKAIEISKKDWDSFETSWDFQRHPFLCIVDSYAFDSGAYGVASKAHYYDESPEVSCPIEACYWLWKEECDKRFYQLKQNEEEQNRIFIEVYGLQDELTPEVADKDVTVRKADLGRDIRSLVSYAIGCMLGRYSLKKSGLQFAGGDWQEYVRQLEKEKQEEREMNAGSLSIIDLPPDRYESLFPDKDSILPITDDEYFSDDIVTMFVEWVKRAFGEEMLEENLKYIASALYSNSSGSARELIRQYFLNDFYKDHLKIYQKRPIYWMFDSGKKNGFKCLVYMHRWAKDTVARVRTDYVHEMQSRYRTAIEELTRRVDSASGSERVRLLKQLDKIQGQDAELLKYEEKVHHLADQMISIDLDDGVKHNYAIFEDVLAPIK